MAQSTITTAQSNPKMHNMYQAYRSMYEAFGIKNINAILPPPQPTTTNGPKFRTYYGISGKPFQAFPGQDHKAHIDAHLSFMSSLWYKIIQWL